MICKFREQHVLKKSQIKNKSPTVNRIIQINRLQTAYSVRFKKKTIQTPKANHLNGAETMKKTERPDAEDMNWIELEMTLARNQQDTFALVRLAQNSSPC